MAKCCKCGGCNKRAAIKLPKYKHLTTLVTVPHAPLPLYVFSLMAHDASQLAACCTRGSHVRISFQHVAPAGQAGHAGHAGPPVCRPLPAQTAYCRQTDTHKSHSAQLCLAPFGDKTAVTQHTFSADAALTLWHDLVAAARCKHCVAILLQIYAAI